MPTALISVSDKTGTVDFCRGLVERGWTIVSTGGTASQLKEAGLPVRGVSEITDHPEILAGRVKTLHPAVHGGILARRSVPGDMDQLERLGISPIDLVAVNLYPFEKTIARQTATLAEALEQIDIGGPTLLRASAKNHAFVWSICDPSDYDRVLAAIDEGGDAAEVRRELAVKVFFHTAAYDATIAGYLEDRAALGVSTDGLSSELLASLTRVQDLRYGENPDQVAAFYRDASSAPWGIPGLVQLHGKELSFNNLLDVDGALTAIAAFAGENEPTCAIVKHTTPCGMAVGRSLLDAYEKALACDPVSAFGSVIAFTQPVTEAVAEALANNFVECVVAPGYADKALLTLQTKKNLRILTPKRPEELAEPSGHLTPGIETRGVRGGLLVQSAARPAEPAGLRESPDTTVTTDRQPTDQEWADLAFAWSADQVVKSNAILLARDGASIGIGAGQMSRVDSVDLAIRKARAADLDPRGSALASDAFFPFRDGIDVAAEAGVTTIIQPGGSIRDREVTDAANEHGMAMVCTGRRLFRH
jgi:phosphoribosylaminoimidazolecarboxamide formyltransferase/IMP cyclohydrolase